MSRILLALVGALALSSCVATKHLQRVVPRCLQERAEDLPYFEVTLYSRDW